MPHDGYRLVWEDSFSQDGPVDRGKWDFDIGTGNNGWGEILSCELSVNKMSLR